MSEEKAALLEALYEFTQAFTGKPGEPQEPPLERALDACMRLLRAERGLLAAGEPPAMELTLRAFSGISPQDMGTPELEPCIQVMRQVVRSGQASKSSDAAPGGWESLCAPLAASGQVLGAIYLEREVPDFPFTQSDLNLLNILAVQIGLYFQNERLQFDLQQANENRAQFISVVTHELRVPMTSIRGYTDLLRQGVAGPVNDQQYQFLMVIRNNLERMSALVSDLADIARMGTGRLKLEKGPLPLRNAILSAVERIQEHLLDKRQTVQVTLPDGLLGVYADPARVAQVLAILLSNAWRYTPQQGQIEVHAELLDGFVRVEVRDNGIGISPQDQVRLFEQFFRSEDVRVREYPGWGLGLCVARGLVTLMGGEIGARSVPAEGSIFWFTLPVQTV